MSFLNFVAGPNRGTCVELRGGVMVLGRNADCDVVLPGVAVSRRHAAVSSSAGTFCIEDTASRNGTLLNGRQLAGSMPLHFDDEIRICDHRMIFASQPAELARQFTTAERLATELVQISTSSELLPRIVDGVFAVLPQAEAVVLMLHEDDGLVTKVTRSLGDSPAQLGQVAARRVMETGMGTLSEGEWETPYDTPARSMMCVPLTVPGHDRPLGVIHLASRTGLSFTSDDLRLLQTLAGHAATAIEGADITVVFAERTRA
jgi:pSer/pThr/pTyr-binding forkhead associated (FHA) protein